MSSPPEQLQDSEVMKCAKEEMLCLAVSERHEVMQCAGLCLLFIGHCSLQDSTLRRKGGKQSTGTVATQTAAELGEQRVLVAVASRQKKKSKTESVGIIRDEEAVGHSTR